MLTRNDVENAIEQMEEMTQKNSQEAPDWEYWQDSGEFHVWRTEELDWLLQVSHEMERFGLTQPAEDLSGTAETVVLEYSDGEEGVFEILIGFVGNPEPIYKAMKQKEESMVIEQEFDL